MSDTTEVAAGCTCQYCQAQFTLPYLPTQAGEVVCIICGTDAWTGKRPSSDYQWTAPA